jgi:GDPmannose 4,6-dehydratase
VARALITGIGGQDGSYLAERLLDRGYEVTGTVLGSAEDHAALDGVRDRIRLVELDLTAADAAGQALSELEPDELYHLAAVSFVPAWWEDPVGLTRREPVAVVALLEALRRARPETRAFFASSAEIFAGTEENPQSETTRPAPLTPYGAAKAFGLYAVQSFRRQYGLHASSGILFNHESPRRSPHFVTRKVTRAAAAISLGLEDHVTLGKLDAKRDWGFAGDYVRAMELMVQADEPDDYVIATGEARTVRELVEAAFGAVGLDWREHVRYDESLGRGATDARALVGDAAKARERLGWTPEVGFDELVRLMVDADLSELRARTSV